MATIRAYRAEAAVATGARVRVYRTELSVTTGTTGRIRVYQALLSTVGSASLGSDVTGVEPWSTVTLTATAPGTPTSWTYAQITGPAVTLVPAGNKVSFVAPANLRTMSVSVSVVANYADGSKSGEGAVDVEILNATEFAHTDMGWVPSRFQSFGVIV